MCNVRPGPQQSPRPVGCGPGAWLYGGWRAGGRFPPSAVTTRAHVPHQSALNAGRPCRLSSSCSPFVSRSAARRPPCLVSPRAGSAGLPWCSCRRYRPAVVVLVLEVPFTVQQVAPCRHGAVGGSRPVWSAVRSLFSSAGARPKNVSLPGPQGAKSLSRPGLQGAKDRAYWWQKTGPTGG